MKRPLMYCTAAISLVAPTIAFAQTATFKTTGGESTVVGITGSIGSFQDGTSIATYSDGSTRNETWTCIGVSESPNNKVFDMLFVCDHNSEVGSYMIKFGCNNLNADGLRGCIGGIAGKSGIYEGKLGGATWSGTDGTGLGTIQWLE